MDTLELGMTGGAVEGEGPGLPPRQSWKEMKVEKIHKNQEIHENLRRAPRRLVSATPPRTQTGFHRRETDASRHARRGPRAHGA